MTTAAAPETTGRQIPLSLIRPSPFQPRKKFEGIDELGDSMEEHGQLQAVIVRPIKDGKDEVFELMAGERRYRAAKAKKWKDLRCEVREATDDEARVILLVENLQREDVSVLEEARSLAELQDSNPKKWTIQAIAETLSKKRTPRFVQQRIAIHRNLSDELKKELAEGRINIEVARTLAGTSKSMQADIATQPYFLSSADRVREQIALRAIPMGNAAFPVTKYEGEVFEHNKVKFFADTDQFMKLQRGVLQEKAERLRKDWRTVKVIDPGSLLDWAWADTSVRVAHDLSREKSADGKIAREKQSAILWLSSRGTIHQALGVVLASTVKPPEEAAALASVGFSNPNREKPADRKRRLGYLDAARAEVARQPMQGLRLAVAALVGDRARFGFDGSRKVAALLPEPLKKIVAGPFGPARERKAWEAAGRMKAPQLLQVLALYAGCAIVWNSHDRKPDGLAAIVPAAVGVKLDPLPKKAKPKAKPKAKRKAAKKKARPKRKAAKK